MKNKKKIALRIVAGILALSLFLIAYYVVVIIMGFSRVSDNLKIRVFGNAEDRIIENLSYTLVTYNIGFGAHSDDYSFFMDGGEHSRAYSEESVLDNINGALEILKNSDSDFLFLQEVDIRGTRSRYVNQKDLIVKSFEEYDNVATENYDSPYLLYPINEPIGSNNSCLLTLSGYTIYTSFRKSLPVEPFPNNLFDLDRAYSVSRVRTANGRDLVLINLHLSAYTSDGTIADEQLKMLAEDMKKEFEAGNFVIAAGDFNKDLLKDSSKYFERGEGEYTWTQPIKTELIPEGFTIYAPTNAPTCRNAGSPYRGDGTDFVVTIDGMIASANVKVISTETIDTGFKYSDHNPVKYEIILDGEYGKN